MYLMYLYIAKNLSSSQIDKNQDHFSGLTGMIHRKYPVT